MHLPPMLGRYFGSKWRSAKHYPKPQHSVIVEPFAGGAGYSCKYPDRQVVLFDKAEWLVNVWRWLISAAPEEIRALPIHEPGETIPAEVQGPARDWIGMWNAFGQTRPQEKMSPCAGKTYTIGHQWQSDKPGRPGSIRRSFWNAEIRDRTAEAVQQIRHWLVYRCGYADIPEIGTATWFIDPPYVGLNHYGQGKICYAHLAVWCAERRGRVIVCENEGADWLPFVPFRDVHAAPRADNKGQGNGRRSKEAICTWDST